MFNILVHYIRSSTCYVVQSVDLWIKNKRTGLHQTGLACSSVPGTDLYNTLKHVFKDLCFTLGCYPQNQDLYNTLKHGFKIRVPPLVVILSTKRKVEVFDELLW